MKLHINEYNFLPDKKRTGQIINEIRKNNKLKLSQFADILCVDEKTVSKWISGYSFPNLYTLDMIRSRFNISFDDLLLPDSKMPKEVYDGYKNEFEPVNISVIKEFDENGYAVNFIDSNKACEELINYKKKTLISDYLIQKSLFSVLNIKEQKLAKLLNVCIANEILLRTLHEKLGFSYKVDLDEFKKNSALYELRRIMFTPNIDVVTGIRTYSTRAKFLMNFIYYLFLSKDKKYHENLLSVLDDFEAELVYNGLRWAGVDNSLYFMDLFAKRKVKRYRHFEFTIECNLKTLEKYRIKDFDLVLDLYGDYKVEFTDIFEKNNSVVKCSISFYIMFMLRIFDCISSNSMSDFVKFIEGVECDD